MQNLLVMEKQKRLSFKILVYNACSLQDNWQLMSNLNIDDLYESGTDFTIEINYPKEYVLESNLYQYKTTKRKYIFI